RGERALKEVSRVEQNDAAGVLGADLRDVRGEQRDPAGAVFAGHPAVRVVRADEGEVNRLGYRRRGSRLRVGNRLSGLARDEERKNDDEACHWQVPFIQVPPSQVRLLQSGSAQSVKPSRSSSTPLSHTPSRGTHAGAVPASMKPASSTPPSSRPPSPPSASPA